MISEHLALLLARLHPDPERAGEEYEVLRQKLIAYFQFRGCHTPEDCADVALDRVAQKLAEGEEVANITAYSYGIAKFVLLEYRKRPDRNSDELDSSLPSPGNILDDIQKRERMNCFTRCLKELNPEEARILRLYWDHDEKSNRDARRELAEELGITSTALRLRIMRIKSRFIPCYEKCAENSPRKKMK